MSIIAWLPAAAFAGLFVVMIARALATPRAAPPRALSPGTLEAFAGVEDKLAALVRVPTVSRFDPAEEDEAAFALFRAELARLYPTATARLLPADAGDRGILLEWPGSDRTLAPAIMTAHFDVVPPGDESDWESPPFSGDRSGGWVRGRGSQDIKVTLACMLEAAERLLLRGFTPRRTVYFAFGGDEETGGRRGAARIASELARRGVKASFLLDEGGVVADGMLPFADRPIALVGISEKGYVDVVMAAKGLGGHASMPPRHTAAGMIAKAVGAGEARRFPAVMTYTLSKFLAALAPYVPFGYRLLFRNLGVTAPLVKAAFSGSPSTNALLRTTAAATMLSASDKENVLPARARAVFNVRILPGSSVREALARLDRIASRFGATATFAHHGHANDPLPESPVEHEGYEAIGRAIAAAHPEAGVAPFMFTAATDTKHYGDVAGAMYRFAPIVQGPDDLSRIHAANERVSVENVRRCCLFYETLLGGM